HRQKPGLRRERGPRRRLLPGAERLSAFRGERQGSRWRKCGGQCRDPSFDSEGGERSEAGSRPDECRSRPGCRRKGEDAAGGARHRRRVDRFRNGAGQARPPARGEQCLTAPFSRILSMTVLDDILSVKRESLRSKQGKRYLMEIRSKIADAEPTRGFARALSVRREGSPRLIAEIKKASPSKGIIREKFHPVEIAKTYEGGGASALSVLTEEHFFLGSPLYLNEVRRQVSLPLLQKDFILNEIQVYEARAWGADAILLIAAFLERRQAKDYFDLARELGLDVLVEIHTEKELEGVIEW